MAQTLPQSQTNAQGMLEQAAWYQALSLSERSASLPPDVSRGICASELAERRLQKWKQQFSSERNISFVDRLAMDQVTEKELLYLLGETAESLQARTGTPPAWLATLKQAFANFSPVDGWEELLKSQPLSAFLHPLLPLIEQGYLQLLEGIEAFIHEYPFIPFELSILRPLLFTQIRGRVLPILLKTFTLELNIARLQGKLEGNTAENRFASFVQQLDEPEALLSLLENYPVLARQLVETIDHCVNYTLEFLTHLCADWSDICRQLLPENDESDLLVAIKAGVGDTHRQGRSVVLLTFRSGCKLLYKPRSLAIDIHFQTLLDWLNAQGNHPALRAARVIDRGTYGWSEYILAGDCASTAEIGRFYQRLGCYLALLYAFQSTDFHFENIIASGEYPMLIDLESLMQPLITTRDDQNQPLSMEILSTSVLRSGMLPRRIQAYADFMGIDISGLGGRGEQLTPQPVAIWEAVDTDQMRLTRQHAAIKEQQNRPTLAGQPVNVLDYLEEVICGFTAMYRLLDNHREELLCRCLPKFAHDEIRIILRPTRTYGQFLSESQHPTLLHNALERERFFERIWDAQRMDVRVVRAELADMLGNDVPLFTAYADAQSLLTSKGESIADFFYESGLATARQKIQLLNEADLARQVWLIRASFTSIIMGEEQTSWKATSLQPVRTPLSRQSLLLEARAVGDRLCELAICGKEEVTWLSLHLVQERQWDLSITDWGLYDGVAGISLYLAYLGAICRETRYTDLARQALAGIRQNREKLREKLTAIGAFNGWGSLLYLFTHLGVLWSEPALLQEATKVVEIVTPLIEKDVSFDVISGVAGLLRCLLGLYRISPSTPILRAAVQCGQHLQAHAVQQQRGAGWLTPLAGERPLAGFSHGAGGIALCLLELSALSGDLSFYDTALAAIEYERSIFSPELQNWPDLRAIAQKGQPSCMTTWCHGAPGIGLARLAGLPYLADADTHAEIAAALQTTHQHGFGMNHSLCHGDLGNLETLLVASMLENNADEKAEVERIAAMILASVKQQGWCTGVPLGIETPGLMTGIAGIGYGFLRLADPEHVPSVLSLEAPYPL